MREIVYKNLTGENNKKRDLCIREVVTRDGVTASIERRCVYFIREKVYVENPGNMEELNTLKDNKKIWKKKHFHIIKRHDSHTGEDRLTCKIAGTFYAIVGHYVFCIAFVQSFKLDFAVVSIGKGES